MKEIHATNFLRCQLEQIKYFFVPFLMCRSWEYSQSQFQWEQLDLNN
jgi:hypothetical protein